MNTPSSTTSRSGSGRPAAKASRAGRLGGAALRFAGRRPGVILASVIVIGAGGAFGWNALVKQPTRHPAPLFAGGKTVSSPAPSPTAAPIASVEPPRRPEVAAVQTPPLPPMGRPETTAAIRVAPEPQGRASGASDPIGALIRGEEIRGGEARSRESRGGETRSGESRGGDPAAPRSTDAKSETARILSAQKALAKLGYGPIKADGNMGAQTRAALENFERARNLPVTGGLGQRTKRQLAARSGVQVE